MAMPMKQGRHLAIDPKVGFMIDQFIALAFEHEYRSNRGCLCKTDLLHHLGRVRQSFTCNSRLIAYCYVSNRESRRNLELIVSC